LNNTHTHTHTLAEEAHTRICVFNVNVIIVKDFLESFQKSQGDW